MAHHEAADGRLGGVRGGHLLHEYRRLFLGPQGRHEHRQERAGGHAELGAKLRTVAYGRVVRHAVWDDPDRPRRVAVAHQVVSLGSATATTAVTRGRIGKSNSR